MATPISDLLTRLPEEKKHPKYVSFIVNRKHFGGGGHVRAILLFPINDTKEIAVLVKRMSSIFCTYLSEFNPNNIYEYDGKCREIAEIVIEAKHNTDELLENVKYMREGIYDAKIIYIPALQDGSLKKEVVMMSHYSFELEIAPAVRDKCPENIFIMLLTKAYGEDREFLKELETMDLGVYKFASNLLY